MPRLKKLRAVQEVASALDLVAHPHIALADERELHAFMIAPRRGLWLPGPPEFRIGDLQPSARAYGRLPKFKGSNDLQPLAWESFGGRPQCGRP